jgi:uncharacterized protein (TIGR03089 family)
MEPSVPADTAVTERQWPLLTYYDDATGERTALTAAELGGWAARVAGLLRTGCGIPEGGRAAVLMPPHWQTAAVLLGAWSARVAVSFRPAATAGLPALGPNADGPFDAVFATAPRIDDWLDDVPAATHRFAACLAAGVEAPEGYRDLVAEARNHPQTLPPAAVYGSDPAAVDGTSIGAFGAVARGMADSLGWQRGERVLVDAAEYEQPIKWLLAPLSVGGSIVVCANLDQARLDARVAAEGVTYVL